ncbi:uncharacterized protein PG986_013946 [Apiospora aurea]|uniref:Uncharacterized protein n=1 Tax=Apiospora aurea TaxID=335848 RepID=A0ABR1PX20_9PEZI
MKFSALIMAFATAFVASESLVDPQTNTTLEGLKARAKGGEVIIGCQVRGAQCSYFKNGKKADDNYEALCASDLSLVDGNPINY